MPLLHRLAPGRRGAAAPACATALVLALAGPASAAVSVQYSNHDSAIYVWEAMCGGSRYTVRFDANATATTTIPGEGPCLVRTPKGVVRLGQGARIRIQDATITVQ